PSVAWSSKAFTGSRLLEPVVDTCCNLCVAGRLGRQPELVLPDPRELRDERRSRRAAAEERRDPRRERLVLVEAARELALAALEPPRGDGADCVEPDVQGHALDVQAPEELRREMEACGRRRGGAGIAGVDRLVALGILERSGDVGRQRSPAVRLPLEPQAPAAL